MKISVVAVRNALVVRLAGELDMHTAEEFRTVLEESINENGIYNVILDLQGIEFIDSSGLGVILGRYRRVNQMGGRMFAAQAKDAVSKLWEMSGMHKIIPLIQSTEMALEKI